MSTYKNFLLHEHNYMRDQQQQNGTAQYTSEMEGKRKSKAHTHRDKIKNTKRSEITEKVHIIYIVTCYNSHYQCQ